MRTVTQKYRKAPIAELKQHPKNPRQGDVGAIHTSIERNGFYGAVLVQKSTGFIIAGNHRVLAAQHAGAATVPVLEVDVDDATALRILLADNRTNDLASYDTQGLAELLRGLAEEDDLIGTGYDGDDLDEMLKRLADPTPPKGFTDPEAGMSTDYQCPACGYEWSGKQRQTASDGAAANDGE